MAKKEKVVLVEWEDAFTSSRWQERDYDKKASFTVHTAGILVEKNARHVVVALNTNIKGTGMSDVITIPSGMVRKYKVVERFEPR